MSTRLFVAIDVPSEVRGRLEGLCEGLPGAKWVRAANLHLTLRFIGDVDEAGFDAVREALRGVACPPFELKPEGLGRFPLRGRPTVLWVGLREQPALVGLQQAVDDAVAEAGFGHEERDYHPHLTLARLKGTSPGRLATWMEGRETFETEPFRVTAFHLYSSILRTSGAEHHVEETYPLDS